LDRINIFLKMAVVATDIFQQPTWESGFPAGGGGTPMGMAPIIWTCLALTLHQDLAIKEHFMPKRGFRIPIRVKDAKRANELQAFILLVSKDQGKVWEPVDRKPSTEREFIYRAPEEGTYWFIVQEEDRAGRTNPSNPERVKPSMVVIVDTVPPQIKVTAERLPNGEVLARWTAADRYPDMHSLRLDYHTSSLPEGQWTPVGLPSMLQGEQKFSIKEGNNGEVRVRVQMKDQAGNVGEDVFVLRAAAPAAGQVEAAPFSVISTTPTAPSSQPNRLTSQQTQRPMIEAAAGDLAAPAPPPVVDSNGPAPSPSPIAGLPTASPLGQAPRLSPGETSGAPGPAFTPSPGNFSEASGNSPAVKIVKTREVRIDFTVGKVGPSGLGNADVWVTLDRGQTWKKMPGEAPISLPPGADLRGPEVSGSVGVQLPAEGIIYGFIVAVKSKAGLAPPPPKSGDPPQALVELDTTAPKGQLYRPQPDPTQPNTLLLTWQAQDRNLGDKPITLEWAEQKDGPWNLIGEAQLPNTRQYSWRLPERLPPRVYLRLTMRDLAGNESRAQTDKPELIDLSVPQTKITGIAPAARP
jgi:hypothetical protein